MIPERTGDADVGSPPDEQSGNRSELPKLPNNVLWGEVSAVLAIGVFPHLSSALSALYLPPGRLPYWLDSFDLTFRSSCVILAVLYLIYRSGEPLANFGLTRPRGIDLLLGLFLLYCSEWLWGIRCRIFPADSSAVAFTPPAKQAADYVFMVIKYFAMRCSAAWLAGCERLDMTQLGSRTFPIGT
jgi:hypothetical protein